MYDLLDVLVSIFNSVVNLMPVGRRVMILYLDLFTEFGDHRVIEVGTIVSDDSLWHTVMTNQVMLDKLCHNILGNSSEGGSFNPLRKVINDH